MGYASANGMVDGFNGIDLDSGLRLDPRTDSAGLSLVAASYSTNELQCIYISSRLTGFIFLWWPIALTGWEMEGTTNLVTSSWAPVPVAVTNNNTVLPPNSSNRFFRIATPL